MRDFLGAIIGDVIGSIYEFNNHRSKEFKLFQDEMTFTDDTVMTVACMDYLLNRDDPSKTLQKWGRKYPNSYGATFNWWLKQENPEPYYSFGNGSAMRVSPVGFYANSVEEVERLTMEITQITHNHPEGLKGALVTSMCVYLARVGASKEQIKRFVEQYYDVDFDYEELKKYYWFNETCQDTVPQAIYCFLISKDFEDCVRTSVSIGGDTDTLCAISCAIAGAFYGIPEKIIKEVEFYLPKDMLKLINEFEGEIKNAKETK